MRNAPAQGFRVIHGKIHMGVIPVYCSGWSYLQKQHAWQASKRRRGMMEPAFRQHSQPVTPES